MREPAPRSRCCRRRYQTRGQGTLARQPFFEFSHSLSTRATCSILSPSVPRHGQQCGVLGEVLWGRSKKPCVFPLSFTIKAGSNPVRLRIFSMFARSSTSKHGEQGGRLKPRLTRAECLRHISSQNTSCPVSRPQRGSIGSPTPSVPRPRKRCGVGCARGRRSRPRGAL